jgi:hypothetical protein
MSVLRSLAFLGLWTAIAIAILKYRLYEIDRIISRTLAYAIVTGLLVGVYAGLVLLATQVFGFHTPVAVAASTLAAAASFSPLRRRVQRVVDRRFNRARYDGRPDCGCLRGPPEGIRGPGPRPGRPCLGRRPCPGTKCGYRCGSDSRTEAARKSARRPAQTVVSR